MKKLVALLLAAVMVIGITACGGGSGNTTTKAADTTTKAADTTTKSGEDTKAADDTKPAEGIVSSKSEMVIRMGADPGTCNVYKGTIGQVAGIMRIFQQGLVQYDKTGAIEYLVAESFEEDADGLGTTVKIRKMGPPPRPGQPFKMPETEGSEDCLYMNIWTPCLTPDVPYPVMFQIHGGAYSAGSGAGHYAKPEPFVKRGVIYLKNGASAGGMQARARN